MTELKSTPNQLKSDLKKLRVLLIFLTLIQVAYSIIIFAGPPSLLVKLDYEYKANWVILGLNFIVMAIFIWFNWKKMPKGKNAKTNDTFMILFLGVIGMWIWIPTKKEINKLTEQST